ncbi:MAG: hypothetical protein PHH18_03550, partial [Acidobacteriota bacterium]|nr:hypothetical protein [Acidobacteriota bacterium]
FDFDRVGRDRSEKSAAGHGSSSYASPRFFSRKERDATTKTKVALEAITGGKLRSSPHTREVIARIAGKDGILPRQIRIRRDRALGALLNESYF